MRYKIIIEKHPDGYNAYPLGLKGIVVGEGDTYEEALADVKSAIKFHIETFGEEVLEESPAKSPFLQANQEMAFQEKLLNPQKFKPAPPKKLGPDA